MSTCSYYASAGAILGGLKDAKCKTEYMALRKCPAANVIWRMGASESELG